MSEEHRSNEPNSLERQYPMSLQGELRQNFYTNLKIWLEKIETIAHIEPIYAEVVQETLNNFIMNLDAYNIFPEDALSKPIGPGQDSPREQWVHEIINTIRRNNAICGRQMDDFSIYQDPESPNLENRLKIMNKEELSNFQIGVFTDFMNTLSAVDSTGNLVHRPNETLMWWYQKMTLNQILLKDVSHRAFHLGIPQSAMLQATNGKFPASYKWVCDNKLQPGQPIRNRQ